MKRKCIKRGILTAVIVFIAAVMMTAFAFADDVQDEEDSEPLYTYTYGYDGEVYKLIIEIENEEDWSALDFSKLPESISEVWISAEGVDTQDITLDLRSCKNLKKLYVIKHNRIAMKRFFMKFKKAHSFYGSAAGHCDGHLHDASSGFC